MGADIYLESVSNAARARFEPLFNDAVCKRNRAKTEATKAKWQAEVEKYFDAMNPDDGYFRDSYNATSMFQVLGWSWWQMGDKVLLDGYLPIDEAKELLVKLEARPITRDMVQMHYDKHELAEGGEPVEDWLKMFVDKHKRFTALLRKSIELNEPLMWSI